MKTIITALLLSTTNSFSPVLLLPTQHITHNNNDKNNNERSSYYNSMKPLNMFTGIVEEMGEVVELVERDDMILWDGSTGKGTELTVKANIVLDGAYLGYFHFHL